LQQRLINRSLVAALLALVSACSRASPPAEASANPAVAKGGSTVTASAAIGKPAPDFELRDLDARTMRLSQQRGKTVVIEWFNPECPFVRASHTKGSLKGLAEKHIPKGVVWLAINSGAKGKQGYGVEANRAGIERYGMKYPVLLDETGEVGHAYDAKHTPHMYVIDAKGVLVYRGAIDNSPDGEGESPIGGTLVNYVDAALADLAAGRPVKTAETEAYGCSVKYASR
jgi:cytochrome oxidase Cu insertion factor (SCO1/SenC/PrrC family)